MKNEKSRPEAEKVGTQNLNEEKTAENAEEKVAYERMPKAEVIEALNKALVKNEALQAENESLIAELGSAKAEAAANKDSWYRSAAEFENFKRRNAETRQTAYFDGKRDAVNTMLVVADSVERALSVELDEKTRAGVELIKKQFTESLAALGVEEIDPVGEKFDPSVAEAIATVACGEGEESGVVKTVYKKGYRASGGKILRYAQVIVTA